MTKMTKGVKICLCIALFMFIAAVAAVMLMSRKGDGQVVLVVQDNVIVRRIDLSAADETIRIDCPDGGFNVIKLKDGTVRMAEADCPDKTCVKTGALKYADIPVVCLPHHLVLRFAEEDEG